MISFEGTTINCLNFILIVGISTVSFLCVTEREVLSSKDEDEAKMSALLGPNPPSGLLGQSDPAPPSYSSTSASSSSAGAYGSLTKVEREALVKMKAITNASDAVQS